MKNWKTPPLDPRTARYVDCYWFLEKQDGDEGHDYPKLNPAPDAHLIIAPDNQPFRYTFNHVERRGVGSHLILPNTKSILLDHVNPFLIIGVKFRVGAFYSLMPGAELLALDDVLGGLDCFPDFKPSLLEQARKASTPEQTGEFVSEMDRWLEPMVLAATEDKRSRLVREALVLLENVALAELSDHLDCSRRTLERAFSKVTGLTLKQYDSMWKLDRLLMFVYQQDERELDWADVAADFGFSDQPHLIRYLKAAIQATPSRYLRQRDLTIDVYGDFE